MDILAARKKAAEREKALKETGRAGQPEGEAAEAAAAPAPVQEAGPAGAVPEPAAIEGEPAAAGGTAQAPGPASGAGAAAADAPEPAAPQAEEMEMLSFVMGGEEYAVMVDDVREILKVFQLTRVPNTPDHILGVMSLRGTVLPLYDLRLRLGLPAAPPDEKARIVVVSSDDEQSGLLVDRVTGVFRMRPDMIRPTPENITQGAEYLRGIVRKQEKLCIVLDLEKALA